MLILKIILGLLSLTTLFWIVSFLFLNDFDIPTISIEKYKKILVIFPHPDDEVLSVGGVMATNSQSTLLLLTKGEKGTPEAHLDLRLKEIRSKEARDSARILKVKKLIQKDYGDGELQNKKEEIAVEIYDVIKSEKPDLIVTYDLSGFYGHPDHMVVSEIVTTLVRKDFKNVELWYTTIPIKTYCLLKLPEHMAKDLNYKNKRTYPTHKVIVGSNVFRKIQATIAHKSQYHFFQDGLPLPILSAFFHSTTVFEYFYKAN